MNKKIQTLISRAEIQNKVKELAKMIKNDYQDNVFCVVILTGAIVFFIDLMRELKKTKMNVEFALVKLKSYKNISSGGKIELKLGLDADVKDKDILIIEDIADTGLTLKFLNDYLKEKGAKNIKTCALLNKKQGRVHDIKIDYCGFNIPDKFVVGYGLDFDEKYRDMDYMGVII